MRNTSKDEDTSCNLRKLHKDPSASLRKLSWSELEHLLKPTKYDESGYSDRPDPHHTHFDAQRRRLECNDRYPLKH